MSFVEKGKVKGTQAEACATKSLSVAGFDQEFRVKGKYEQDQRGGAGVEPDELEEASACLGLGS